MKLGSFRIFWSSTGRRGVKLGSPICIGTDLRPAGVDWVRFAFLGRGSVNWVRFAFLGGRDAVGVLGLGSFGIFWFSPGPLRVRLGSFRIYWLLGWQIGFVSYNCMRTDRVGMRILKFPAWNVMRVLDEHGL